MQDPDPQETQIVALLAAARARDRAPAALRARIEREHERARTRRPRRLLGVRPAFAVAAVGVLAAVAVMLAIALPGGTPGAPTVAQAAALALRGASGPAPVITHQGTGTRLSASVDEVYFPDWHATIGWTATGSRTDTLAGHRAVTVYYTRESHQVAYTIVATPPLPEPQAEQMQAGSFTVRVLRSGGRTVVTWRKAGDTCVLSGAGLSAAVLAKLAGWSDQPGTA